MIKKIIVDQIVNLIFTSNSYILSSEQYNNFWLVDCGDIMPITTWIDLHKKELSGIFVTHTHFDHIYGLNEIISLFPSCKVYTSDMGLKGLYSDKLNLSHYNGDNFNYQFDNVITLNNTDRIELFPDIFMDVIATPGHDPSCLVYCCCESIFTGDSYLPDYEIITRFPNSDKSQAENSLKKIYSLTKSGTRNIYPGHGKVNTLM